jgi:predicted neuraminidase
MSLMNRLLLGVILIAFGIGAFKASQYHAVAGFQVPLKAVSSNSEVRFQSSFASSMQHIQTHAASEIELKDGRIRAFWFSGSSEGAKDVEIHSAVFNPASGLWGAEQTVATREGTEQSVKRYISKLGNPVAGRAADGTLWLYYVTVSMGGWAGSSITAMTSVDEGATWSPARRLITSPFLNISTLVKGTPFLYSDGTMGLPVYHEFISKFGEILHFDKAGKLIDKQRLSAGKDRGLQPVLLVKNANEALVLMRHNGDVHRKVISVSTSDGGLHWTAPVKSALSSPDAALSAVVLPDGRLLAVLNNLEQGRDALSLMISADGGGSWKNVYQLEDQKNQPTDEAHYLTAVAGLAREVVATEVGEYAESVKGSMCAEHNCRFEFSYPYLIQARSGDFHLVYTWNRSFIKHVWFTQAWLDQRLKETVPVNPFAHD